MSKPELWLIAGPNGAGKSTIVGRSRHLLSHIVPNVPFINPDEHARQILLTRGRHGFADSPLMEQKAAFIEAAMALEKYIGEVLESGGTVGVETVLSTAKYQRFVELVLRKRGVFGRIYVALNSPSLACKRVAYRVENGGHDVPKSKIHDRWNRSLSNLPWFLSRSTFAFVFDNSSTANILPALVARKHGGVLDASIDLAFPELRKALVAAA